MGGEFAERACEEEEGVLVGEEWEGEGERGRVPYASIAWDCWSVVTPPGWVARM